MLDRWSPHCYVMLASYGENLKSNCTKEFEFFLPEVDDCLDNFVLLSSFGIQMLTSMESLELCATPKTLINEVIITRGDHGHVHNFTLMCLALNYTNLI